MNWSPQQEDALKAVAQWRKTGSDGQQVFRLFGYAGTGKTTLAKHLAADAGNVLFATFTGKAAHVLRSKGCPGASTIHSLIYQPRDRSTYRIDDLKRQLDHLVEGLAEEAAERRAEGQDVGQSFIDNNENVRRLKAEIEAEKKACRKPIFELKEETPLNEADLLVVDECSMVGDEMAQDLMSFGVKILVLGDPAQLPPVRGSGYFTEARPDVLLTEIHRQARDNPIIDLATRIREGLPLEIGEYGDSRVIHVSDAHKGLYTNHDQMLVGTNKTRKAVNREFRRILERDGQPTPVAGDRLVCLRNNHDLGLLNGSLWRVKAAQPPYVQRIHLDIEPADGVGVAMQCVAHEQFFLGGEPSFYEMKEAESFDFGYALTVHKAQGSQWDSVLILDESASFREHRDRWLYTAITRAAERVTVVLK